MQTDRAPHIPLHILNARNRGVAQSNGPERRDGDRDRVAERTKAIKTFLLLYEENRFAGTYEEDFQDHLEDLIDTCNYFDVPDMDRVYFFKFTLCLGARQLYKRVVNYRSCFADICRTFREIYAADTNKDQMSTRLQNLSIDDFRGADDDDYQVALDALLR